MVPTITILTASNPAYTTPVGCKYIKVYWVGGGGGGGGGGPVTGSRGGSGGGSGGVRLSYFGPGTYAFVRGTGGAGGAAGLDGADGVASSFNGLQAAQGLGGTIGIGSSGFSMGGLSNNSGNLALCYNNGRAGSTQSVASGNGGANFLGRDGQGYIFNSSGVNGGAGNGFGGGGGGGVGTTSVGGAGRVGGAVIIEYY